MRLVVTGGGTGGHVFPALEVARLAVLEGWDVLYMGSRRGQEVKACERMGLPFIGFPSKPVYSLKTPQGWSGMASLLRAKLAATKEIKKAAPHVIFSTGGYSSAPVVYAAKTMHMSYVLHEQNSVPGRTNRILSKGARMVAVTFDVTKEHLHGRCVRTGMPVRQQLRDQAAQRVLGADAEARVLVFGGSQGSAAINEAALATAQRMAERDLQWMNITGRAHFETHFSSYEKLGLQHRYQVKAFLEGADMGEELARSSLVASRSGTGTLSELAAFRLPSVLIPYPQAYANHQFHNAMEFVKIGAATLIPQSELHPTALEKALLEWMEDSAKVAEAQSALAKWDSPTAANQIIELLKQSA